MLFAASLVVLLLTCMNVGGLLVARLNDRIPELATRAVLGATRFQLVQQVVVETGLLALAGGIGGVAIALYGTSAARLIPLERLPFWTPIVMDSRVLVLAAVLALVGGLALSIAPLVTLSPPRIASELRALVVGAPTRARGRRIVVGLEVAFSVVLFGISGILIKQLVSAERIDLGSAKRSVVFVALANRGPAKDGGWPDRMIQGLYVLPRVHAVAISGLAKRMTATRERRDSVMRAPSALRRAAVYVEGRPDPIPDLLFRIATIVTRDFFTATGIRLVAGRPFAATDDARAPGVIVINETAARKAFGDASAIGKRIRIESGGTLGEWLTIVGVVPDQRQPFSTHPARLEELYRPWGQVDAEPANVAVRVEGDSREIAPLLPKAMHAVDPSVAIASVDPVEVWFDRVMWAARFTTDVLTTFALFALVLACLGVYATVSYVVGRRRREMAIRVAMGATQRDVISSVLRSSITMLLSGLGAGVVGAIIVARLARSMLFGSDGLDIIALGTAVVAIFTAGVIAAYLPARRAAVADPLVSLRAD
jgi:putative ABC transport system permease protein